MSVASGGMALLQEQGYHGNQALDLPNGVSYIAAVIPGASLTVGAIRTVASVALGFCTENPNEQAYYDGQCARGIVEMTGSLPLLVAIDALGTAARCDLSGAIFNLGMELAHWN